jgi:hypothetical protein
MTIETRIRAAITDYVSAWNEPASARRAEYIERCCAADLRIVAPGQEMNGRAGLEAAITTFQRTQPGCRGRLVSDVEVADRLFRFVAVIDGPPGTPTRELMDVGECDAEGRIRSILTFVGAVVRGWSLSA